jgi:cytochrome b
MTEPEPDRAAPRKLLVWDLPVRAFHWALVVSIAIAWRTGSRHSLDWHRLVGYSIAALLIFRLAWGIVGSATARFTGFVRGPGAIVGYTRRSLLSRGAAPHLGHNPLGGWSVVAMLAVLIGQVALGLVSVDVDGLESGPFAYLVSFETGRTAAELHHLLFNILLGLIALHLVAVCFYLVAKRQDLVGPMITGRLKWTGSADAPRVASLRRAAVVLLVSVGSVAIAVWLWGRA